MSSLIFKKDGLYKLSASYVPERLPGREEHQREIFNTVIGFLEGRIPLKAIVLNGPSGSGKTVTVKKASDQILKHCARRGISIEHRHLNARFASSDFTLSQMIALSLMPNIPSRGYSSREFLYTVFDYLEKSGKNLLLVLDDFDNFLSEVKSKFFADLLKISEEYEERVKIILILVGIEDISRHVKDPWVTHFLWKIEKGFTPYGAEEISMILRDRVMLAFNEDAVEDPIVYMIGRLTERFGYGSARYGIELLLVSGLNASYEGSAHVSPEHVREAQYRLESIFTPRDLESLIVQDPETAGLVGSLINVFESCDEAFVGFKVLEEHGIRVKDSGVAERLKRLHIEGLIDYIPPRKEVSLIGMPLRLLQDTFEKASS
ncbi:MAG: Cdc6/Cdc18 family protein [Thermoproteota archaeon]